eukprot:NODE_73_length_23464_cov_0.600171.p2 type:complete len:632 gc:universal NODE_73_length_23464_cov_0.600171:7584-5689(-)
MDIFSLDSQEQLEFCQNNLEDAIDQIHQELRVSLNVKKCQDLLLHLSQLNCPNCLDPLLPHYTHTLLNDIFESCPFHIFLQQYKALTPLQVQQRTLLNYKVSQLEYHLSLLFNTFVTNNHRIVQSSFLLRLFNKLSVRKCDHSLKVTLSGLLCLTPWLKSNYNPLLPIINNFNKQISRKSNKSKSLKNSLEEYILYHQSRFMNDFQFYRLLSCTPLELNRLSPLLELMPIELVDMICLDLNDQDKTCFYSSSSILYNKRNIYFKLNQLARSTHPLAIESLSLDILKSSPAYNPLIIKKFQILIDSEHINHVIHCFKFYSKSFVSQTESFTSLNRTDPLSTFHCNQTEMPLIDYFMTRVVDASLKLWNIVEIRLELLKYYVINDLDTAIDLYLQYPQYDILDLLITRLMYNCDVLLFNRLLDSVIVKPKSIKLFYLPCDYSVLVDIKKSSLKRLELLKMMELIFPMLDNSEETRLCYIKHVFKLQFVELLDDLLRSPHKSSISRSDSKLENIITLDVTDCMPYYAYDTSGYKLKNRIYTMLDQFNLEYNNGCFYSLLLAKGEYELMTELIHKNKIYIQQNVQEIFNCAYDLEGNGTEIKEYLESEFEIFGMKIDLESEEEDTSGYEDSEESE